MFFQASHSDCKIKCLIILFLGSPEVSWYPRKFHECCRQFPHRNTPRTSDVPGWWVGFLFSNRFIHSDVCITHVFPPFQQPYFVTCKDKVYWNQLMWPIVTHTQLAFICFSFYVFTQDYTRNLILNLSSSLFPAVLLKISSFSWPLLVLFLKHQSTFTASRKSSLLN